MMSNALNWFEIPAADFDRATKFYGTILAAKLEAVDMGPDYQMAMFPSEEGVGGAIMAGEGYAPSTAGSLVYLNGGEDLTTVLDRVEAAGGQIVAPKTEIGENGFVAYFIDSEGNRVGLHSMG
jgi:predicted enzyme related to lactoylglutathione lyase